MTAKIFHFSFFIFCSLVAFGQEIQPPKKTREYYLGITNISPIDLSVKYKRQLKNNLFLKIGLIDLSMEGYTGHSSSPSSIYTNKNTYYSAGLASGLEFRKSLTDKFLFFHGPNISFTYRSTTSITYSSTPPPSSDRKTVTQSQIPGVQYTFGFLVQLNDHFLISAEINPGLYYSIQKNSSGPNPQNDFHTEQFGISFSTQSGLLSFAYRL